MNFRTQSLDIDPDKPFESDPFGRKLFANKLNSMLKASGGITVFVHSPWGHGKSTFIKQWKAEVLRTDAAQISVIDAFSKDHVADAFIVFLAEIKALIEKVIETEESVAPESKKAKKMSKGLRKAVKVGGKILVSAAKQTGRRYLGTCIDELGNEIVEDLADEVVEESGNMAVKKAHHLLDKLLAEVSDEENLIMEFRLLLEEVAASFCDANNGFPLTVVVDELDRCRPDFALDLLEKMKHFFDVPNVSFVLVTDKNQLAQHVAHAYGLRSSNMGYISKFGDVFCELPNKGFAERSGSRAYRELIYNWSDEILGESNSSPSVNQFQDTLTGFVVKNRCAVRDVIGMLKLAYLKMFGDLRGELAGIFIAVNTFMVVMHPDKVESLIDGDFSQNHRDFWLSALGGVFREGDRILYYLHCLFDQNVNQAMFGNANQGLDNLQVSFMESKKKFLDLLGGFSSFYQLES